MPRQGRIRTAGPDRYGRPRRAALPATTALGVTALFVLAMLLAPAQADGQALRIRGPATPVRVGDVATFTITAPAGTAAVTVVAFDRTWPVARQSDTRWQALVGIDLDHAPGRYEVASSIGHAVSAPAPGGPGGEPPSAAVMLEVAPRAFRRRVLRVAPEYVNPPPEILARITSEAAFLDAVYAASGSEPAWPAGFLRPVAAPANSSFGTRSIFNGEERSPHAGTDFLSGPGTPIRAPAGGRVVAARDLFFSGNTVIIDHGLGVFSMLAHLQRIDVREGEVIARGTSVGLVGSTGRVTGPHLHWALRVGGARVDPLSALRVLPARR